MTNVERIPVAWVASNARGDVHHFAKLDGWQVDAVAFDVPESQTHYADDAVLKHCADLVRQLAEAQAREMNLREALQLLSNGVRLTYTEGVTTTLKPALPASVVKALARPQDSTALDKWVKDAQVRILEEAAGHFHEQTSFSIRDQLHRMAQKLRGEN